jgi:hypothetical protein
VRESFVELHLNHVRSDHDAMLTASFGKRGRRMVAQSALVCAVLGGAAAAGAATTGVFSSSSSPSPQAQFAVLNSPQIPLSTGSPILHQVGGQAGLQAHHALDSAGFDLSAVASTDGQFLCLTVASTEGKADTCRTRADLAPTDVIWIRRSEPDGSYDVFGLAPDGITAVHGGSVVATPQNNAFVLQHVGAAVSQLSTDGPSVHGVVDLGTPNSAPTTTTVTG